MTGMEALRVYYARNSSVTLPVFQAMTGRDARDTAYAFHEVVEYTTNGTVEAFNDTEERFRAICSLAIPARDHEMIAEMCLHAYVDYVPPNHLFLAPADAPPEMRNPAPAPEDMAGGDDETHVLV